MEVALPSPAISSERAWSIHRVKNHLTSATALLRLTLREPSAPDPKAAIEAAARRIDVLAKVYDRLHLGERNTVVSAREFITGLCGDLHDGVIGARPVSLKVTADDANLGSIQAVPVGLVVNELVENAIKYAFPANRPGEIKIRFECQQGRCVLTVADDGVGYDPQNARKGGGARLIGAFAHQLGAEIDREAFQRSASISPVEPPLDPRSRRRVLGPPVGQVAVTPLLDAPSGSELPCKRR